MVAIGETGGPRILKGKIRCELLSHCSIQDTGHQQLRADVWGVAPRQETEGAHNMKIIILVLKY